MEGFHWPPERRKKLENKWDRSNENCSLVVGKIGKQKDMCRV